MNIKTILTLIGSAVLWAGCSTTDHHNNAGGMGDSYYESSGSASSDFAPIPPLMNTPAGRASGALDPGTGGGGIGAGTGIGSGSTGTGH